MERKQLLGYSINEQGFYPSESSQTTHKWPLVRRTEAGEILVQCVTQNCSSESVQIQLVQLRNRQALLDEVFEEHAEAWRRLAEL